jgi:UDP-glucose 4-epimerase
MDILVTGGCGFIGGRLVQQLSTKGFRVVIGSRNTNQKYANIIEPTFVKTDWENPKSLVKICKGMDVVIHTAGMNARDCEKDPASALDFNGIVTGKLAKAAVSAGVKHFIYCSTVHVYNSPLAGLITEEHPTSNNHPYASSHLAGENALLASVAGSEMKAQVLRISNVYGAPVNKDVNCWELLVNDLCRQIAEKKEMQLYTAGTQYRDFISMSEVCKIVECLCEEDMQHNRNEIFNVSSGRSETVMEIMLFVQSRAKNKFGFLPDLVIPESKTIGESGDQPLRVSNNKICQSCNFSTVKSAEEIDRLLDFCHKHFSFS